MSAVLFDLLKAFIPVLCAIHIGGIESWGISFIAAFALMGHAFTPFLRFKGGKSLAVTGGVWAAISNGWLIIPVLIFLGVFHSLQKTHVWTIILTMFVILSWILLGYTGLAMIILWIFNIGIIVLKHKNEVRERVIPRSWLINIIRKQK